MEERGERGERALQTTAMVVCYTVFGRHPPKHSCRWWLRSACALGLPACQRCRRRRYRCSHPGFVPNTPA
jgi:hypothetical protein